METLKQITRIVPPKTALKTTALLLAASSTVYSINLYQRLNLTNRSLIQTTETASESFRKSPTIRGLVNPRGHTAWEDTRSITLPVSAGTKLPSEEALLSKFVHGFFGGRVFLLERTGLQLLRKQVVVFDGLAPSTAPQYINRVSEFPTGLPALYSVLWGHFQVTDVQVAKEGEGSTIDFVYGSNRGEFAGCHRFTVRKEGDENGERVFVSMECITCNPKVDQPISGKLLFGFHKVYAMLLFRDAVGDVVSLLE